MYEVTLKTIEPIHVASIQGMVPEVRQIADTFDRLFGILEGYVERCGGGAGPPMAIYHDAGTGPRMLDMRVELAIPFNGVAAAGEQVRVYNLPRVVVAACVIHVGPFETIGNAYEALYTWTREHGYTVAGPSREVYLNCGTGDSSTYTTEVQFPVTKTVG
jgi:effector-binding domain-containing protein